jgi:hypothetical protein
MYGGLKVGSLVLSLFLTLNLLQLVCDNVEGNPSDSPVYMVAVMSYMRDRRKWSKDRVRIIIRVTVYGLSTIISGFCTIVFVAALLLLGGDIESNPGPSSPAKKTNISEGRGSSGAMTSQPVPEASAMDSVILQRLQQMEDKNEMTSRRLEASLIRRLEETQNDAVASLKRDMHEMKESLSSQLKTKTDQLQKQCTSLQKENQELKGMINELSLKCDYLENHSRRNNLLFFGLRKDFDRESWGDCEEIVREAISDGMGISEYIDIERAHRTKNNAIVVKLLSFKQKNPILGHSRRLKSSEHFRNVTVKEDFSVLCDQKEKGSVTCKKRCTMQVNTRKCVLTNSLLLRVCTRMTLSKRRW